MHRFPVFDNDASEQMVLWSWKPSQDVRVPGRPNTSFWMHSFLCYKKKIYFQRGKVARSGVNSDFEQTCNLKLLNYGAYGLFLNKKFQLFKCISVFLGWYSGRSLWDDRGGGFGLIWMSRWRQTWSLFSDSGDLLMKHWGWSINEQIFGLENGYKRKSIRKENKCVISIS